MPTRVELLSLEAAARPHIETLIERKAASRLAAGDATLWGEAAQAEAAIRLGWVHAADASSSSVGEIVALRQTLAAAGVHRIVLCGMGGSSLAPEVITARDGVELTILDSTNPSAVNRIAQRDVTDTAVVVSSKSGSTIETRSQLAVFEQRFADAGIPAPDRIIVVTDPGSPLEVDALDRGYRVFQADPQVGGRYSALTAFGLVPAGLAGADIEHLLSEAQQESAALTLDSAENPAVRLAAALMAGLPDQYACAIAEATTVIGLGDWIEQLIAESTGKQGRGVLPVVVHPDAPELTGALPASARLFELSYDESAGPAVPATDVRVSAALGAQFLLWETATALLCNLMQVNPFDQPDVESAKSAARAMLEVTQQADPDADATQESAAAPSSDRILECPGGHCESIDAAVQQLRDALPDNGYLALQIFADRDSLHTDGEHLRELFAARWKVPVTLGWGPRFLHSTGQLHKGGPRLGVFLQIFAEATDRAPIPGERLGFGELIAAQAHGDRQVLLERGRPVLAIATHEPAQLFTEISNALRTE